MNKRSLILMALFLSACAGSRDVVGDFEMISAGQVPVSKVMLFKDCVSDKFRDRTAGLDIAFLRREQRRSDGYRVELVATSSVGLLISADIFDDGRVELHERNALVRRRLQDERDGFAECLNKFKI